MQSAWQEDLLRHIDFEGWQFIATDASNESIDKQFDHAAKNRPIVCFGFFQDFLGFDKDTGQIKQKTNGCTP